MIKKKLVNIAVTQLVSRVLERVLWSRLWNWYNEITDLRKTAFRCARCLQENLVTLKVLAQASGTHLGVLIDLIAAFDKAPRPSILQLLRLLRMPDKILSIIESLYSSRLLLYIANSDFYSLHFNVVSVARVQLRASRGITDM
jgi:hypothetical protein